jgi:hypothetical protein
MQTQRYFTLAHRVIFMDIYLGLTRKMGSYMEACIDTSVLWSARDDQQLLE